MERNLLLSAEILVIVFLHILTCRVYGGSKDLEELRKGANASYLAPAPLPLQPEKAKVPPHNLTRPSVDYKYAVIMDEDEQIWLKQLNFIDNGVVKVHKSDLTEVWEDIDHGWVALRVDTSKAGGGGACLLLPINTQQTADISHTSTLSLIGSRRRRREIQPANSFDRASYSLASLRDTHQRGVASPRETFVALRGPLANSQSVTGTDIAHLCATLDIYTVEKVSTDKRSSRARARRQMFKSAMRIIGWLWNNRRVLGIPFGVRGNVSL